MSEWTEHKQVVIDRLIQADIDPKSECGKALIKLERSMMSVRNLLYNGSAVQYCFESGPGSRVTEILNRFQGIQYVQDAEFGEEWARFCSVSNYHIRFDLSDVLS